MKILFVLLISLIGLVFGQYGRPYPPPGPYYPPPPGPYYPPPPPGAILGGFITDIATNGGRGWGERGDHGSYEGHGNRRRGGQNGNWGYGRNGENYGGNYNGNYGGNYGGYDRGYNYRRGGY
uniref:Uncharacterized protein n=1 Tax=Panagrolaimus sp. JU765 TaxID=591449 RepID=A0AC34RQZ3_9BILA